MRKWITAICLLTASLSYSQGKLNDSVVVVKLIDVTSCIEAFDELDSCLKYEAIRNTAITGLLKANMQRDSLLSQKDKDYGLLNAKLKDVEEQKKLATENYQLSETNFGLLKDKKNKQLIGWSVGGFCFGVGCGVLATALLLK